MSQPIENDENRGADASNTEETQTQLRQMKAGLNCIQAYLEAPMEPVAETPATVPSSTKTNEVNQPVPGTPPDGSPPGSPTSPPYQPPSSGAGWGDLKPEPQNPDGYTGQAGWGPPELTDTSTVKHTTSLICDENNRILSWKENYVIGPTDPTVIRSSYQKWFTHIAPTSTGYDQVTPKGINLTFENNDRGNLESVTILLRDPITHEERTKTYQTLIPLRFSRDHPRPSPDYGRPFPPEELEIDIKTGEYKNDTMYAEAGKQVGTCRKNSGTPPDNPTYAEVIGAPFDTSTGLIKSKKRKQP